VAAGLRYRRHPVVRRDRRLAREADRITELIANVRRQIASLEERRQTVLDSVDEQRAERLQELREEVIYDHLKHHFIGELRQVEGLTHKHVVWLKSANIRTAYEATRERIGELRRMPNAVRARIAMWRASLVREAEDDLPDDLSPAEERRLRRYVEHRIEDIDAEIRRAEEKIEVQSNERDTVQERRAELPDLSWGRYLGFLLYAVTLPRRTEQAPTPPTPSPARANAESLPEPTASDAPWWEQQ
jgi:restriction endonuclease S subunit